MKPFIIKIGVACLALVCGTGSIMLFGSVYAGTQEQTVSRFQQLVQGVVRNQDGIPLQGVSVRVVGTNVGTLTAADGTYSISLPAGSKQLSFTFLGHEEQTLTATGNVLDVFLTEAGNVLEELVVVGYGSMSKKDLMGSLSTVNSKDFNVGLVGSTEQVIKRK